MSKQDEANLILKLYELRREETMRKARDWYFRDFNPASMEDVSQTFMGAQGAYVRMVWSYWDMAAALVHHGAISFDLFQNTNGEHIGVFAKVEPFLGDIRSLYGPHFLTSLEALIDKTPNGRERVQFTRQNMQAMRTQLAKQAAAAGDSSNSR